VLLCACVVKRLRCHQTDKKAKQAGSRIGRASVFLYRVEKVEGNRRAVHFRGLPPNRHTKQDDHNVHQKHSPPRRSLRLWRMFSRRHGRWGVFPLTSGERAS
jgi:hypothetical protein